MNKIRYNVEENVWEYVMVIGDFIIVLGRAESLEKLQNFIDKFLADKKAEMDFQSLATLRLKLLEQNNYDSNKNSINVDFYIEEYSKLREQIASNQKQTAFHVSALTLAMLLDVSINWEFDNCKYKKTFADAFSALIELSLMQQDEVIAAESDNGPLPVYHTQKHSAVFVQYPPETAVVVGIDPVVVVSK